MEGLPHSVVAAGWIPFTVASLLTLLFSTLYVLWHRSSRPSERAPGSSLIAVAGLSLALATSLLVPVDVFLTAGMKAPDGSWRPWAHREEVREDVKKSLEWSYYTAYGGILAFAFLVIPANFFYHGLPHQDEDGEEPSCGRKLCHALKFTLLSCLVFGLLVTAGVFLPLSGDSPPGNSTEWQKVEWFFLEVEQTQGRDLFLFLLSTVSTMGTLVLAIYTGSGLPGLPARLLGGRGARRTQLPGVEARAAALEASIAGIQGQGEVGRFEQSQIDRLEQQLRLLRREQRDLQQRARTLVSRCQLVCRPFQVGVGVVVAALSLLLGLSLLLSNVDRAMHSSARAGYALTNSSLPAPLDLLLVAAQQVFPLDYILYTGLVVFLLACSVSGLATIGIRCCCLVLYRIRAWRTPPRGLLLGVLVLMGTIVAQNVVLLSLVPDYTMFGNQHYNDSATGRILRCRASALPETKDQCVPSRISALLLSFHARTWVFGAAYYWLTWAMLGVGVVGTVYQTWRACRGGAIPGEMEEDLIDSEGEEGPDLSD